VIIHQWKRLFKGPAIIDRRIFVLKLGEEKDVTVVMKSPGQFQMTVKVGFFSKKVLWNRVDSLSSK
jgi:hypothetical protein